MISYLYKTEPRAAQREAFERSCDLEFFAFLMEQGTGKTKVTIDSAAYMYNLGRINAVVVLAPNGVHRNWVKREVPKHLPDYIEYRAAWWNSSPKKAERDAIARLYEPGEFLRIYTFNVEGLAHARIVEEVKRFLLATRALLVVDESSRIKSPSSERTKNILKLAPLGPYRRILTGTPITQSPLDAFTQFQFLSKDIWPTESYTVFRSRYAEIMPQDHPMIQRIKARTGARFGPTLVATDENGRPKYKNLEELRELIKPHSFRVLKKDCLDLPPKIYKRRQVELGPAQRKCYRDLVRRAKDGLIEGEDFSKPLHRLNLTMYLQRVLCGVRPGVMNASGHDEPLFENPLNNPRIQELINELQETDEQAIVWANYISDIQALSKALRAEFGEDSVTLYYGAIRQDERDKAVDDFESGRVRFFLGNPAAAGIGLTLVAAGQVHYYSNSFKLEDRLQSEDRAHRDGQTKAVVYVDYEVEDSIDTKVIDALLAKKDVADIVTGDDFTAWLDKL